MAGNLIDNYSNKYQQNVVFQSQQQPVMQPVQKAGKQTVDTTPQSDTFNPANGEEKSGIKKPLFIFASWLGLNKAMDLFNKGCTNENYDKTIIGRLGNFGDRVSKNYGNSPIANSTKGVFKTLTTKLKNFINGKPVLSAIFNTPTSPENQMVKGFMETQKAADLTEATRTITGYLDELPKSFKEAGATKAELAALKAKYGTNIFGGIKNKTLALQELQFNRVGAAANFIDTLAPDKIAETLKEMKIKHLGMDPKTYEAVLKNPSKHLSIITEACKRGGKTAKAFFGRNSWIPGLGLFTKRSTNLSMSYNKLMAETKHVSKLGRFLAKAPKIFMRGLTFGGGKINSLLVAFGFGTALYNATKAPKKQKVGTAVAGGVDAVSWIVSMPLAVKIMHSFAGMQNAGLSKMQVGRFSVALKNFNKDVAAGKFLSEVDYNKALKTVMDMKKVAGKQSFLTRAMVKTGKLLGIALETPAPFKEATKALTGGAKMAAIGRNLKRMLPKIGKNALGYPLRFALYAMVFSPIVDKVISSCTSALFGKPYEPEEKEEAKDAKNAPKDKQQVAPQQNYPQTSVPKQPVTPPQQPHKPVDINNLPNDNLIKREVSGEHVINEPINQYVPSDKCEIDGITSPYDKVERSYIPNDAAPVIQNNQVSDRSTVDAAIAKADKVEAAARNALNGIY